MTELTNEHFHLISANKDRQHKKKMRDTIDDLLKKYDADDLVAYIMDRSEQD
jgi:hypothetical protein